MAKSVGKKEAVKMKDGEKKEDAEMELADLPELRSSVGLCGFMELVFHHLMCVKNIYPKRVFRKYVREQVPIYVCDNPELKEYVFEFLDFANKLLMKLKKLKICFVLCRRNKEVIEEFYFELKVNDMFVDSESELVCVLDNLVSICKDIEEKNTFHDFNTIHSGEKEITFELQLLLNPNTELPEQKPDFPWKIFYGNKKKETKENKLTNMTHLKDERNKTYEVKAYGLKKP